MNEDDITQFDIPDNWEIINSGFQWVAYGPKPRLWRRALVRVGNHINFGNCCICSIIALLVWMVWYSAQLGG